MFNPIFRYSSRDRVLWHGHCFSGRQGGKANVLVKTKRCSAVVDFLGIGKWIYLCSVLWQVQQAWIFRQSLFFALPMLFDPNKVAQWKKRRKNTATSHLFPLARGTGLAGVIQHSFTSKPTLCPSFLSFSGCRAQPLLMRPAVYYHATRLLTRYLSSPFGRCLLRLVRAN